MMRPHTAIIRVYDSAGNVIATHEHKGRIAPESLLIAGWQMIRHLIDAFCTLYGTK
jgi:hypothetical protein